MERLTARLWGGVKIPALETLDLRDPDKQTDSRYRRVQISEEEAFRALLNDNQKAAFDGPWEAYSSNKEWQVKDIPVYGSRGGFWRIQFLQRRATDVLQVHLLDPTGRGRCFHAVDQQGTSYNTRNPYASAAAFLCQVQTDEAWVLSKAG